MGPFFHGSMRGVRMQKHDFFNAIPLSEVCSQMVDESGRPLKAIAADVGKGYSTLYRELDANDEGGKLGVDTLLPLIRACLGPGGYKSPPAPVLWLNSKTGYKAVPLDSVPDREDVRDEVLDDLKRCNEFWQAARDMRLPPERVLPLCRAAQEELEQTMEQYRRQWQREGVRP